VAKSSNVMRTAGITMLAEQHSKASSTVQVNASLSPQREYDRDIVNWRLTTYYCPGTSTTKITLCFQVVGPKECMCLWLSNRLIGPVKQVSMSSSESYDRTWMVNNCNSYLTAVDRYDGLLLRIKNIELKS
jgi:hypothetical protein